MKEFITKNWIALCIAALVLIYVIYKNKSKLVKKDCNCNSGNAPAQTNSNPLPSTQVSSNGGGDMVGDMQYYDDVNEATDGELIPTNPSGARWQAGKPCAVGSTWSEDGVCEYNKVTASVGAVSLG